MAIWRWRAPGGNAAASGSGRENRMRVAMSVCSRRLLLAISLLAIAGIAVSSVSLYHHYGSSRTSYCDIGENFNCDIVNRSTYSTVLRIPVALIGIIGYLGLLALSTVYQRQRGQAKDAPGRQNKSFDVGEIDRESQPRD